MRKEDVDQIVDAVLARLVERLTTPQGAPSPAHASPVNTRRENLLVAARKHHLALAAVKDAGRLDEEAFKVAADLAGYRGGARATLYTRLGRKEPFCLRDEETGTITLSPRGEAELERVTRLLAVLDEG